MERCDPKGRDCIEKNSAATFNCSTTCVGIYADVIPKSRRIEGAIGEKGHELDRDEVLDRMHRRLAELERKMSTEEEDFQKVVAEGEIGKKGHELDREKYKLLIAEYRKFKSTSIQHFSFSSTETSVPFGRNFEKRERFASMFIAR